MKLKKCQLDCEKPCVDKGFACLTSDKEKREYNEKITEIQDKLESIKFTIPDENK